MDCTHGLFHPAVYPQGTIDATSPIRRNKHFSSLASFIRRDNSRSTRYRCDASARLAGNAWYSTVSRANAILSASNSWLARVTDVYAPRSDELERATSFTSPATCAVPRSRLLRILGKICLVHSEFLSRPVAAQLQTRWQRSRRENILQHTSEETSNLIPNIYIYI